MGRNSKDPISGADSLSMIDLRLKPEILLTEIVAYPPTERIYCRHVRAWTLGGRIATCTDHLAMDSDCVQCWHGGIDHPPCEGCGPPRASS